MILDLTYFVSNNHLLLTSTVTVKNDNGSTAFRTVYAVKRIPRERTVYDSPIIYDVFSEITSLELLAGNKGVRIYKKKKIINKVL